MDARLWFYTDKGRKWRESKNIPPCTLSGEITLSLLLSEHGAIFLSPFCELYTVTPTSCSSLQVTLGGFTGVAVKWLLLFLKCAKKKEVVSSPLRHLHLLPADDRVAYK